MKCLFFPLKGTTFKFINESDDKNKGKEHHWTKNRNTCGNQIPMSENPWDEENNINIEKNKQHGRYVKFDRVSRFTSGF